MFQVPLNKDRLFFSNNFVLSSFIHVCAVTTCCVARDALSMLQERKNSFDIIISDVNMPDMDGFQLLEHLEVEMDLPVICESIVYFFPSSLPHTLFFLFGF